VGIANVLSLPPGSNARSMIYGFVHLHSGSLRGAIKRMPFLSGPRESAAAVLAQIWYAQWPFPPACEAVSQIFAINPGHAAGCPDSIDGVL